MPGWLVIFFPLIVFLIILPPIWLLTYRQYKRHKQERTED